MGGKKTIKAELDKLNSINKPNPIQKAMIIFLELALEMILRGYKFYPVDMKKSLATEFTIEENGLRMPFISLDSLGEVVANNIVIERNKAPFSSLNDIKKRSGINKTIFEKMKNLGILDEYKDEGAGEIERIKDSKTLFDFF